MRTVMTCAIRVAMLALVAGAAGATTALAQCPPSPSYSPDFTANQNCLALNRTNTSSPPFAGSPSFQPPATPQPSVANVLRLTANQAGWATSAWYQTAQPVANGFSTTFAFQIGNSSTPPVNADGIAFVIQNSGSGTLALGNGGCGIGFGQSLSSCAPKTGGISNSVAIEFNTFLNGGVDPSSSDVAIQNCQGVGPNSVDPACTIPYGNGLAVNDLTTHSPAINLADNNLHVATITYTPSALMTCGPSGIQTCSTLDVVLDGVDLFPGGVYFDLHSIGLSGSNAFVGFTAATGGDNDDQDIVNWAFTPQGQTQTGTVAPGQAQPTTFNIGGGFTAGSSTSGYNFSAQETTSNQQLQMVVTAIPISQAACNSLVQKTFGGAECFVYQNGGGQGVDTSVLFEVTCPPNGSCGSVANPFFADLGTQLNFECAENFPLLCGNTLTTLTNTPPEVGFLKGEGPDAFHPCTPLADGTLFQSNQIESFALGDVSGSVKGGSGGTTSCWTMTYLTPGELPSVTITQPANGALYLQGQIVNASYTCNAVNNGSGSAVGPYLALASCTGPVNSGSPFDTSTLGPHNFAVQVEDSATNTVQQSVSYTVVTGAAPASGTKCNGVYYGTFKGNITVVKGQSCTFVGGGVTGSVTELGGSLALANATVGGNIAIGGGTYSIGPSTTVKGNVAILATTASAMQNQVCGASIAGGLTFSANQAPVAIGSSSAACPGNVIAGNLVVSANLAATAVYNNTVGGNLLDQLNLRPTQVFNNRVTGILSCSGDTSITGGGNTAIKKQGQCANF